MSARLRALVARHAGWRRDAVTQDSGCLTVVTGRSRAATARAFGLDLSVALPAPSERSSTDSSTWPDQTASLVETAHATAADVRVSIVMEDNGSEGSREVVLRPASKAGKAASVFWNTNGMVLFSCARRGKILWSGELGIGADLEGLPRRLVPLAELVEVDEAVDPVAVGAVMVETFTGAEVRAGVTPGGSWHVVTPHVEQPPAVTAESSGLKWSHPDLVTELDRVAPAQRRPLVHLALHKLVRQAGLAEDPVVVAALAGIGPDAPGVLPPALDSWERRWGREGDRLGKLAEDALNGHGTAPTRAEELGAYRPGWVANALRYACHPDDRSALLGVADDLVHLYAMDGHEAAAAAALLAAVRSDPGTRLEVLARLLPAPPSPDDRRAELLEQRRAREAEIAAFEAGKGVEWWGAVPDGSAPHQDGWAEG